MLLKGSPKNKFSVKVGILSQPAWPPPLPERWDFFREFFGNFRRKRVKYAIKTVLYKSWDWVRPPPSLGQNPNFYRKFVLHASLTKVKYRAAILSFQQWVKGSDKWEHLREVDKVGRCPWQLQSGNPTAFVLLSVKLNHQEWKCQNGAHISLALFNLGVIYIDWKWPLYQCTTSDHLNIPI